MNRKVHRIDAIISHLSERLRFGTSSEALNASKRRNVPLSKFSLIVSAAEVCWLRRGARYISAYQCIFPRAWPAVGGTHMKRYNMPTCNMKSRKSAPVNQTRNSCDVNIKHSPVRPTIGTE